MGDERVRVGYQLIDVLCARRIFNMESDYPASCEACCMISCRMHLTLHGVNHEVGWHEATISRRVFYL